MQLKAPSCLAGALVLSAGLWLLAADFGSAAAQKEKDAKDDVARVADLLAKNDLAAAKKVAAEVGQKYDVEEVMKVLGLRNKKGFGVGPAPGAFKPDGIEQYFLILPRKPPAQKDTASVERAAYITAAIAEIVIDKCPVKKKEKDKDPKEWKQWTEDMRKASLDLAAALKNNDRAAIKKAVTAVNDSCTNCHGPFRQ